MPEGPSAPSPEDRITQVITSQQVIDIFAQLSAMNVKLDDIKELAKMVEDNRKNTDRTLRDHERRLAGVEADLKKEQEAKNRRWNAVEWLWNNSFALFLALIAAGIWSVKG